MDEAGLVPISVEWALHGQESGQRGYRILGRSDAGLTSEDFTEIIGRFHSGTPEELPQVTTGWAGAGAQARLVTAIQERSDAPDWLGRPLVNTRLFCVSYDQLTRRPVGYEALHDAFAMMSPSGDGVWTMRVPSLDPEAVASRVTEHAMVTAALLLTGSRICLVDGESAPLRERLRYIDTVAALLPYGMRTKLSTSTWTSSTAEHRIRLSFTKYGRGDAHSVSWTAMPEPGLLNEDARAYLELLREAPDRAAVIAGLAEAGEPLSFRDVPAALEVLRKAIQTHEPVVPRHAEPGEVGALLAVSADALDRGWHEQLEGSLRLLEAMAAADHESAARESYRQIVTERRMLTPRSSLPEELAARLYRVILRLAYGPALTAAHARAILDAVPRPSGPLVEALVETPHESPVVALILERCLGVNRRSPVLASARPAELVRWVVLNPADRELVESLCSALAARGSASGNREVAKALHENGYLAAVIENLFPGEQATQVEYLVKLLTAAYGPVIGDLLRNRIADLPAAREHPALWVAADRLCPQSARPEPEYRRVETVRTPQTGRRFLPVVAAALVTVAVVGAVILLFVV